jgi:hypothetical protein
MADIIGVDKIGGQPVGTGHNLGAQPAATGSPPPLQPITLTPPGTQAASSAQPASSTQAAQPAAR